MENFPERVEALQDEELRALMARAEENMIPYEAGEYLLTDDKAPVELLGMQVIDELIFDEIGYYKNIFKEQGISGLLHAY